MLLRGAEEERIAGACFRHLGLDNYYGNDSAPGLGQDDEHDNDRWRFAGKMGKSGHTRE